MSVLTLVFGVILISVVTPGLSMFEFRLTMNSSVSAEIIEENGLRSFEDNWFIDSNQSITISNQTIILNRDLIVNSSGLLKLINVTLILNGSKNETNNIIVSPEGKFILVNCWIKGYPDAVCSAIILKNQSTSYLKNCRITNLGKNLVTTKDGGYSGGAIIAYSDELNMVGGYVENSDCGLHIINCTPSIENVEFSNCDLGIFGSNAKAVLIKCRFDSNNIQLKLNDESNVTIIDMDIMDPQLSIDSIINIICTLNVRVEFKTPIIKPVPDVDVLITNDFKTIYSTSGFNGLDKKTNSTGEVNTIYISKAKIEHEQVIKHSVTISAKYQSRSELNRSIDLTGIGPIIEVFSFENVLPQLLTPSVSPWSGDSDTEFVFKVHYIDLDNDQPGKVQLDLDDATYNMSVVSEDTAKNEIDWNQSVDYQFKTKLLAGEHKFRFISNDGLVFDDVTAPTGNIPYLIGPTVIEKNHDPELSSGSITPSKGKPDTVFKYRVKYQDQDGDVAKMAKVYIDNIPHKMTAVTEQTIQNISGSGVWYEYETKLPIGTHEYYFKFQDANNSNLVYWPKAISGNKTPCIGPIVSGFENKPPVIGNGSVTPGIGHSLNLYSYTISYFDHEGDLPTHAVVVIDGKPYNLSRARIAQDIYFFETFLGIGQHSFHFEFYDGINKHFVRYPSTTALDILGPLVLDLPPYLWSAEVTPDSGTTDTQFTFKVNYRDLENAMPEQAKVIVDNISHDLVISEIVDEDASNNNSTNEYQIKTFLLSFSTKLGFSLHSYYFTLHSSDYDLRFPKTGFLNGPQVRIRNDTDHETNSTGDNQNKDNNEPGNDKDDKEDNPDDENHHEENQQKEINEHEKSISEFEIVILNYSAKTIPNFPKNVFNFTIICKAPSNKAIINEINCWVFIDGEPFLMSIKVDRNDDVLIFNTVLELSAGEHYYHYVLSDNYTNARLPYKGEFIIVIEDVEQDQENDPLSLDNMFADPKDSMLKILFLVLLVVVLVYFSFYRKYVELSRYDNENEIDDE